MSVKTQLTFTREERYHAHPRSIHKHVRIMMLLMSYDVYH